MNSQAIGAACGIKHMLYLKKKSGIELNKLFNLKLQINCGV